MKRLIIIAILLPFLAVSAFAGQEAINVVKEFFSFNTILFTLAAIFLGFLWATVMEVDKLEEMLPNINMSALIVALMIVVAVLQGLGSFCIYFTDNQFYCSLGKSIIQFLAFIVIAFVLFLFAKTLSDDFSDAETANILITAYWIILLLLIVCSNNPFLNSSKMLFDLKNLLPNSLFVFCLGLVIGLLGRYMTKKDYFKQFKKEAEN